MQFQLKAKPNVLFLVFLGYLLINGWLWNDLFGDMDQEDISVGKKACQRELD